VEDCADMFITLAKNTSMTGQALTIGMAPNITSQAQADMSRFRVLTMSVKKSITSHWIDQEI
jgi:hypothetical protein